jgi:hypothetical protein
MQQDKIKVGSNFYWKYGLPTVAIVVAIILGFVYFSQVIAWSVGILAILACGVLIVKFGLPAAFNGLILVEKYKQERIATTKAKIDLHFVEKKAGTYQLRLGNKAVEVERFYPALSAATKQLPPEQPLLLTSGQKDLLDLIENYPHTLIWGGTRTGKTSLLRTIAYRRKMQGHRVLILDSSEHPSKWEDLDRMETKERIDKAIKGLFRILDKNIEALRTGQAIEENFEQISVVTDEWTEIVAENEIAKEFINKMVRQSFKYGIHLIFATQTNLAADLGLDGRYRTINGFLQLEIKKRPDNTRIAHAAIANEKLGEFEVPKPPPLPELLPTDYVPPSLDFNEEEDAWTPTEEELEMRRVYRETFSLRAVCRDVLGIPEEKIGSQHTNKVKEILKKFGCVSV